MIPFSQGVREPWEQPQYGYRHAWLRYLWMAQDFEPYGDKSRATAWGANFAAEIIRDKPAPCQHSLARPLPLYPQATRRRRAKPDNCRSRHQMCHTGYLEKPDIAQYCQSAKYKYKKQRDGHTLKNLLSNSAETVTNTRLRRVYFNNALLLRSFLITNGKKGFGFHQRPNEWSPAPRTNTIPRSRIRRIRLADLFDEDDKPSMHNTSIPIAVHLGWRLAPRRPTGEIRVSHRCKGEC